MASTEIDSLPYYDTELDANPDLRPQLNSEIAVELRKLLPSSRVAEPANLSHLSSLSSSRPGPSSSSLLGHELARLESKKTLKAGTGLDTTRYGVPAPSGKKAADPAAWEEAYRSSLAQVEHQRLRLVNSSLMASELGPNSWKVANFAQENLLARLEKDAESLRVGIEETHRGRKATQEQAGEVLDRLERRWTELVSGNLQLEIGCLTLETEVTEMYAKEQELRQRIAALQQQQQAA